MCRWLTALVLAAGVGTLAAQDFPEISSRQMATTQKTSLHRKSSAAKPEVTPVPDPPPPPPAPEMPKWPVNDAPAPPQVKWDSHGLQVDAPNSSLKQILDEVASTTGATVEGLGPDERVYGTYGPGPARDVLSQILHGSTYNVMMLGDQGEGTPREIILSQRTAGGAQPGQVNNRQNQQDDDADQPQPEPEEPNRQTVVPPQPMNQPAVNPPNGPMTPQQRMLEMQRQQMLMLQQQQQQQPVPQPQPQQ